jgi:hypothetical protein
MLLSVIDNTIIAKLQKNKAKHTKHKKKHKNAFPSP